MGPHQTLAVAENTPIPGWGSFLNRPAKSLLRLRERITSAEGLG